MKLPVGLGLFLCAICFSCVVGQSATQLIGTRVDELLRSATSTYYGDPIGRLFHSFQESTKKAGLQWPHERQEEINSMEHDARFIKTMDKKQERFMRYEDLDTSNTFVFEGISIGGNIENQPTTDLNLIVNNSNTSVEHVPFDTPRYECGKGTKVGDVANACFRRDCNVNILRCGKPNYPVIDSENYARMNLSECKVQELQCSDHIYTFTDWMVTSIYQLRCNDQIVAPEDGDLDHCTVETLLEGSKLLNFTNSPDETKCWVDHLHCPDYCENISAKCQGETVACNSTIHCVDGSLHCNQRPILCGNEVLYCNDSSITCNDVYPACTNIDVTCNGNNPCEVNGETLTPACNEDGLVTCNGTLAHCNGKVISCTDTEMVTCTEEVKEEKSYNPYFVCRDTLDNCKNIIATCDGEKLNCPDGYTWYYNETLFAQPVCIEEQLIIQDDWYGVWYDYREEHFLDPANTGSSSSSSSSSEEDETPDTAVHMVLFPTDLCRVGALEFNCSMIDCVNKTISCGNNNTDSFQCIEPLQITGDYHNWHATCQGEPLYCTADPPCDIEQIPCKPDEQCTSLVYECNDPDNRPNDCQYNTYNCTDACWIRVGEWECLCPLDFMGEDCEYFRPYLCNITLIDPVPACRPFSDPQIRKLDTDPICLEFSVNDTVRFSYQQTCWFTNTTNIEKSNDPRASFNYYARRGNEYAISAGLESPQIMLKIFNFNHLSDTGASVLRTLSPSQVAWNATIYFDIDFHSYYSSPKLRKRYFSGGRMYIETDRYRDVYGKGPRGIEYRQTNRQFIDFKDFEQIAETELPGFFVYLFITFADPTLLLGLLLAGFAVYYFVKRHQLYETIEEAKKKN